MVFDPWNDVDGNAVDDPFSFYGKDKMDEFCRRILAKKEGSTPSLVISVDSKILDFLKMLYFGVTDNPFEAASRSAYTDMCRTIRFNGKNGDMLRKVVDALLEERIPELVAVNDAEDPELQSKWDKAFWARGYYVETIGNITDEAVQKYIKEQAEE